MKYDIVVSKSILFSNETVRAMVLYVFFPQLHYAISVHKR